MYTLVSAIHLNTLTDLSMVSFTFFVMRLIALKTLVRSNGQRIKITASEFSISGLFRTTEWIGPHRCNEGATN